MYAPPTMAVRAGANVPNLFTPATGVLDSGFGWKQTPKNGGALRRYASYAPAVTLSYAVGETTSVILSENASIPANPTGGTSNVLLVALQRTLSPGFVVDVESEYDLTPATGYHERAIGFGGAFSI